MTEQTTSTSTVETAQAPSPYQAIFDQSRAPLEAVASEYNNLVSQLKSHGNEQDQVNDLVLNSDDPAVVAFREWLDGMENDIAEARNTIEAHIKANLVTKSDFDVDAAKAKSDELKKQHKALTDGLKVWPGGSEFVDTLTKLQSAGRGGNSTGTQRQRNAKLEIRVSGQENWDEVYEDVPVKDKEGKLTGEHDRKYTFSVLQRKLKELTERKVDTATIYEHNNAANTNDGRPYVFAISVPKADGNSSHNFEVRVTPKNDD